LRGESASTAVSGHPSTSRAGSSSCLVDDGLATGSTMRAAVAGLRQRGPQRIVVGVPIAAPSTCEELASEVDDIVCAATPEPFYAVALWYADFPQTTDQEVRELLEAARRGRSEREYASAPVEGL
jgi:putative phosphoribosyl transferase